MKCDQFPNIIIVIIFILYYVNQQNFPDIFIYITGVKSIFSVYIHNGYNLHATISRKLYDFSLTFHFIQQIC